MRRNYEPRAQRNLAGVSAVILAGGLGTRLRSVVTDRPKVLAEVRGRSFLAYLLDQLAVAGVRHVVLCTGYLGEQVENRFGKSYRDLELVISHETSPLGTAGALRLALPFFRSDPVLVMNGDSFCDIFVAPFFAWHIAHNSDGTLVLVRVTDTARYGSVHVDAGGAITGFNEKGKAGEPGWINTGIYLLARSLLSMIPEGVVSLEKEMFPAWIGRGLHGYKSEGRFLDIGTPEAYMKADQFFAGNWRGGERQ